MYMDLRARHTFGMPFSNENYADIRNGSTGVFEESNWSPQRVGTRRFSSSSQFWTTMICDAAA